MAGCTWGRGGTSSLRSAGGLTAPNKERVQQRGLRLLLREWWVPAQPSPVTRQVPSARRLVHSLVWFPSSLYHSIIEDKPPSLSGIRFIIPTMEQTITAGPSCTLNNHMTLPMKHLTYSRWSEARLNKVVSESWCCQSTCSVSGSLLSSSSCIC